MSKFSKFSSVLVSSSLLIFLAMPVVALGPAKTLDATTAATRKQNVQQKVEAKITGMSEKIASREAAMKLKLKTFKDKRKAEIAERVNTNLNMINQKQTSEMQKHLNNLSTILDKLSVRVNQATPDIKDPTAAKAVIASARANIASASSAVAAQAEKDYTVQVTSETRIKSDVQTQRDKLKTDLMAVRKMVIDAKQSVAYAIRIAKSGKEATPSGQQ